MVDMKKCIRKILGKSPSSFGNMHQKIFHVLTLLKRKKNGIMYRENYQLSIKCSLHMYIFLSNSFNTFQIKILQSYKF